MLEKFSSSAQRIISLCESLAFEFNHSSVGSEHLLLALLKSKDNTISKELSKYNIDYYTFYPQIRTLYSQDDGSSLYVQYTFELKEILSNSIALSEKNNESLVSVDTLSYILISEENVASELLVKNKVNINGLMKILNTMKKRRSELLGIADLHLMGEAKKDPLVGRDSEITQLINALSRRNKPNAILLGEPGVGKTALVEEVAKRIYDNKIPNLKNKRIYELDIASTISGTKYRGEFEEKLKKIIKKVIDDKDAILFIDEIHTIVKAGGAEGAIDASNILKPYLSRGEIQLIGATTEEEFNLTFEKDKALKRRFQLIRIEEPTSEETIKILCKIKPIYEKFYKIKIDDYLLEEIVKLAKNNLLNQKFPDKAIDILDNSCVIAKSHLTMDNINETMASYYKIKDTKNITTLKENLYKEVVGQDAAIDKIVKEFTLIDNINKKDAPKLVLLFNGPSGCGKSKCINIIARSLFGEQNIVTLNLCNYRDINGIGRLVNASSSNYLESVSPLVKILNKNPSSLVVLENIDKTSIEVKEFIKDIFDKGYFYDNRGNHINCKNAVFILISSIHDNVYGEFKSYLSKGNEQQSSAIEKNLGEKLFSQIDEVVEFGKLDVSNLKIIATDYIKRSNLNLEIGSLEEALFSSNMEEFDKRGVREIHRKIKQIINEKEKIKNN